mgnify:CR=1 FL=1
MRIRLLISIFTLRFSKLIQTNRVRLTNDDKRLFTRKNKRELSSRVHPTTRGTDTATVFFRNFGRRPYFLNEGLCRNGQDLRGQRTDTGHGRDETTCRPDGTNRQGRKSALRLLRQAGIHHTQKDIPSTNRRRPQRRLLPQREPTQTDAFHRRRSLHDS